MKRILASISLVLLLATGALADTLATDAGNLASAQSSTGASTNSLLADGAATLYVEYVISATATVKLQQKLHGGTDWRDVSGSSQTSTVIVRVDRPGGVYRAYSTISSGTVTVNYQMVMRR